MAAKKKLTPKQETDLEVDYRVGVLSLRAVGKKHNISAGRIVQLAEERGWERDLSARIAVKRKAKLNTDRTLLNRTRFQNNKTLRLDKRITEEEAVEAAATSQADLITKHQNDINQYQGMCNNFLNELHVQGLCDADLERIGELVALTETQGEEEPDMAAIQKRLDSFYKILNLGGRADTFKKLVESKAKLVQLERVAHGIKDDDGGQGPAGDSLEARLKRYQDGQNG